VPLLVVCNLARIRAKFRRVSPAGAGADRKRLVAAVAPKQLNAGASVQRKLKPYGAHKIGRDKPQAKRTVIIASQLKAEKAHTR
jgi:hypothetical protein